MEKVTYKNYDKKKPPRIHTNANKTNRIRKIEKIENTSESIIFGSNRKNYNKQEK